MDSFSMKWNTSTKNGLVRHGLSVQFPESEGEGLSV